MADVGDRIAVVSKWPPRSGVVTAISGAMITVRWDTGSETSLIPGPGVLSVVTGPRRSPSSRATAAARKTSAAGSQIGVAKRGAPGKEPAAKKAASGKRAGPGKKPVAKKAASGKKAGFAKKPVAKETSSSRTTGKKTR